MITSIRRLFDLDRVHGLRLFIDCLNDLYNHFIASFGASLEQKLGKFRLYLDIFSVLGK